MRFMYTCKRPLNTHIITNLQQMNIELMKKTQELNDTMLSAQGPYWRTLKDLNALVLEHKVEDHIQLMIDCLEDSHNRDDSSEGRHKSIAEGAFELFPAPGSQRNHQQRQKHLNACLALSPIQNQEEMEEKPLMKEDESSSVNPTLPNSKDSNSSDEESLNQETQSKKTKKKKTKKDRGSSNEITSKETKKTKKIKKTDPDFEISPLKPKKIYPCQRNHRLKNFLQDFWTVFKKYLRKAVNNDSIFFNIQIINTIITRFREGKGISMDEYEKLMIDPILRPLLKDFFEKKVLYHHLMRKINPKNKIAYSKHLHVFERAYISKEFTSII